MHYSKNMSWYETDAPLVKQNVMKFEFFILGGQRIDQKRKNGWWRGSRERIEKGKQRGDRGREKRDKVNNLKRRIRNIDTCLCLLFSFPKALRFP